MLHEVKEYLRRFSSLKSSRLGETAKEVALAVAVNEFQFSQVESFG